MFNGEGYHYWKTRMQIFKETIDLKIWEAIIKKGENVNHEDFDDVKKIKPWIMSVIIKKGENMDHALF